MDHPEIINWRRSSPRVSLSGQPTEAQLAALAKDGVTRIINLGPHWNDGALENEAGTVSSLGMKYVYIPVDFDAPTDEDFERFCAVMKEQPDALLHVHCIYNARVSAFFYRYAKEGLGGDAEDAFVRMDGIWRPGGVWATFIGKPEDVSEKNRYLGHDY
jgi:protein tyrosine phosphatase (PTP) superfamily phosphohydrolase (DUF442 family)